MCAKECLSATTLSKKTSATLEAIEKGDTDKFFILKNNTPKAVLMSIDAFEAIEEEMEDLRLATLALARLQGFKLEKTLTHAEMMKKFDV
ncbi:MAG TPA: type II toxin-antitoxin system Phd/YefM family antitoxin [Desulfobacterales bacterium]|nr:type II toxin-antitoxin system Phd/YefM family antitoxin [Desulfobacterales bacterium]